ncbi:MAG: porin [Pseudomonadota bacterium]
MKRTIAAGLGLALGSGVAPAAASEFEVTVGGDYEVLVGYGDSDVANLDGEDFSGVDVKTEGGIEFRAKIGLDNGIEIGAAIVLEATTDDEDQIDESYMFIDSAFGMVELGSRVSGAYTMSFAAPDVTFLNINDGQTGDFIPFDGEAGDLLVGSDTGLGTLNSTFIENGGNDNAQRITYFTPRIVGLQLGLSYARDPLEDDNTQVDLNDDSLNNIFDVGVNYVAEFDPVSVAVSGRWGIAFDDSPGGDNPQIYAFGANIGFAGVTIGGSFSEQNNTALSDGTSFDVGISYETGPWSASFTYMNGENLDDENALLGADEELDQYLVGVTYGLAEGVDIGVYGAYVDFEEEVGDAGGGGDDVDGFIVGTGIAVAF